MVNIGNNIFDNLKQMRRSYVAPDMLVEEVVEEREMLAGSPSTSEGNDPANDDEVGNDLSKSNTISSDDLWFGTEDTEEEYQ